LGIDAQWRSSARMFLLSGLDRKNGLNRLDNQEAAAELNPKKTAMSAF
jgi:hypothetical protein